MTKTTDDTLWAHVGEPAAPPAGFGWIPGLLPEHAAALRSMEFAEKLEQREREERIAERQEMAYNLAVAESMSRAHAHGERWDPADPLRFYPSVAERTGEVFAAMDMQAAAELRQARREAAKVLADHGIHAQVVVDSNQPAPRLIWPRRPGSRLPRRGLARSPHLRRGRRHDPGVPRSGRSSGTGPAPHVTPTPSRMTAGRSAPWKAVPVSPQRG